MQKAGPAFLTFLIVPAVLISGCSGEGPVTKAINNPFMGEFVSQHPNANIHISYYTRQDVTGIIEKIREECATQSIEPGNFYLINMSEGGFNAVAWVDWDNQSIICAYKSGSGPGCSSHNKTGCHGDHVYWFDSCNNLQERKDTCTDGCWGGECVVIQRCETHSEYKCHNGNVHWFDSCGNPEEEKEHCDYGCENRSCSRDTGEKCWDSDGGKDYFTKGISEEFTGKRIEDYCTAQGMLVEAFCYGANVSEETHECPEGCWNGACIRPENLTVCNDSDGGQNFFVKGEVSGFEPVEGTIIEHESEIDVLNVQSTSKAWLKILGDMKEVTLGGRYEYPIGRMYIKAIYFYGINDTRNYIITMTETVKDHCLGNYTAEFYCLTANTYGATTFRCEQGCLDGACVNETA